MSWVFYYCGYFGVTSPLVLPEGEYIINKEITVVFHRIYALLFLNSFAGPCLYIGDPELQLTSVLFSDSDDIPSFIETDKLKSIDILEMSRVVQFD
eukprot:snap_masked-scaffold_23-processed-gene-4.28-mRNA-1 protein AED:1.00 eAED:1.00 QI:0/0/0/0/1/1/2/0/95